jgi:ABC-type sugar transport system ATPase subunit
MIVLEHFFRRFGEFALGPVDLHAQPREYWVLLGPTGAGKSMLLQSIAGIYAADAGRIFLGGRDVTLVPPEARGVGFVFQQSALFPHLTVTANIEYGLVARHVAAHERRRRVDELVSSLSLAPLLSRPVASLSGGEAQKIALARALAFRPSVLLLDEPLGPIDAHGRAELQEELRRIHAAFGLTTLHVTHNREEAALLATHCAVLNEGKVIQQGTKAEVFGAPANEFVARFLGAG